MSAPSSWFERYVQDTDFLRRYPFYAGVLAGLRFESTTRVPIMGVRWSEGTYQLLVNEPFFAKRPLYRAGVLLHEVHHLVLGHLDRRCFFDVARPDLMQLAMETSANEYVTEPLPDPILWQDFRDFGFGPHQSTMERYELLCRRARDVAPRYLRRLADDGHGGDRDGSIGIADVLVGRALPAGATAQLHQVLVRARAGARPRKPPARLPSLASALAASLQQVTGPREADGLLARDVDAVIAEFAPATGKSCVDWRSALHAFVGRGPGKDPSRLDRRQPHRPIEVPGRSWRLGRPSILVAIDSSGSMGPRELGLVARELRPLSHRADLTIVECDCAVRRVYRFRGEIDRVVGGGGTDLSPPFAPELVHRHGRDGIVYFTDGDGPWPRTAPPVPVLWVLTSTLPFDCPFGRRVHLQRPADVDDDYVHLPF